MFPLKCQAALCSISIFLLTRDPIILVGTAAVYFLQGLCLSTAFAILYSLALRNLKCDPSLLILDVVGYYCWNFDFDDNICGADALELYFKS